MHGQARDATDACRPTDRRRASAGKIFLTVTCRYTVQPDGNRMLIYRAKPACGLYALWRYSVRCFLVFLWNDTHAENVHELSSHMPFFT